ncbi:hypothetical protein C2G38_2141880 [Gigaspora rosea]|uniref:F-box domain-containing protein n=1 Tax=Gigaspora rosea TaxID=44941 RepID=A0A397VB40_9GLOM|nr:hypothetical protein C2G38_2141880 [Gigaspora rosea]
MNSRIRDRTLPFFKDFSELRTLNLSKTKSALDNFNRKGWPKSSNLLTLLIFPNREEELDDIIYCMTFLCGFNLVICSYELPLIKMDLTGFIKCNRFGSYASCRKLKYLDVGYTRITDKGVKELRGLPHLSSLNFDFTQVSLSCRNILADIPSLQPVRLNGITKEICEDEYYDI